MKSSPKIDISAVGKFVNTGIILTIDQLIVSVSNWVYWLLISKFASTSQIGYATTIYSLILLITTITQLGFEYPLLRKANASRSSILGTIILIELGISSASIPFLLYTVNGLYGDSLQEFAWLSVVILLFSSLSFVTRFALLGVSDVRNVLLFDLVATIVKFAVGYSLVYSGYGTLAILVSFLAYVFILACGTLAASRRSFAFKLGARPFVKEMIKDGLVNAPAKLSRVLVVTLAIVLLAYFGISSSETGIFYITAMITMAAGVLGLNMAYMVLPASSVSGTDLYSDSTRIGLSFTSPIIAAMITAPAAILSIIGSEYAARSDVLLILSIGILPSIISANTIAKLNNQGRSRELLLIGCVQLFIFLIAFFLLVPQYGINGAALGITVSLACSAVPAALLSDRRFVMRHIAVPIGSIVAAYIAGYLLGLIPGMPALVSVGIAAVTSIVINLRFKSTSTKEIGNLVRAIIRK